MAGFGFFGLRPKQTEKKKEVPTDPAKLQAEYEAVMRAREQKPEGFGKLSPPEPPKTESTHKDYEEDEVTKAARKAMERSERLRKMGY